MKTTIKKAAASIAAVAMMFSMSVSAYAEDRTEDYTREEIIQQYWGDHWENSLPGEQNPEGSLEYHILEQWLDEQYGHTRLEDSEKYTVSRWSSYWSIRDAWQDYREEYTQYWHMVDDKDTGEFYIESYDPETDTYGDDVLYTFDYADGKWNMIDVNGNIVDSFDPHGGDGSWTEIKENQGGDVGDYDVGGYVNEEYQSNNSSENSSEVTEEHRTAQIDNGTQAGGRVTGDTAGGQSANTAADKAAAPTSEVAGEKAASAQTDKQKTDDEESSSSIPFIIGGIFIVAIAAVGGYAVASKKRKGDGK